MAARMNDMDPFERRLKESLEQYEVPYNSADWAQMERALASGVRGWGHGRALVAGLLLAGGLLIGGTAYYLGRDTGAGTAQGVALEETRHNEQPGTAAPGGDTGAAIPPGTRTATEVAAPPTAAVPPMAPAPHAPATHTRPGKAAKAAPSAAQAGTTPPALPGSSPAGAAGSATMFRASMKEACPGSPVDFTVEHMPDDGIYLWNFGDGSFSNKPNPQHTFTKPGNYQVMLSMSSMGMGTIHNKPSSDMIVIHDAPSAAFNVLKQDYAGQLPSVHFENRSQGAKSYQWDLGDGTVSTMAHPDHVYRTKGVYKVELTVTNETGCVDRKMKEVRIEKDFNLGAPASFSPNGDGKEETFMPQALLEITAKFELAVYDPAGILVYSTSDPTHPWCGKLKNQGLVCSPGEYVWVVDVETGNQGPETFTGKVKLLP